MVGCWASVDLTAIDPQTGYHPVFRDPGPGLSVGCALVRRRIKRSGIAHSLSLVTNIELLQG